MKNWRTLTGILEARKEQGKACVIINAENFEIWKVGNIYVSVDKFGMREVMPVVPKEDAVADYKGFYNGAQMRFKITEKGKKYMKVLPISVYRSDNGLYAPKDNLTSRYNKLLLICPDGHESVSINNLPENLVAMEINNLGFSKHANLRPYVEPKEAGWFAGYCIGYTPDGRFGYEYPLQIHDFEESWSCYERNSD